MKSTFLALTLFLFSACGVPPIDHTSNENIQERVGLPNDSISVYLGSTRSLKPGEGEYGVFRGRANARISHERGRNQESYTTNWNGTINSKIEFKKDDKIYFKSMWIEKPLIIKNNLDVKDSTSIPSAIKVAINENDSTNLIYGKISGLMPLFQQNEIFIFANNVFMGFPDKLGRYAVPTDAYGNVSLVIVLDKSGLLERAVSFYTGIIKCENIVCDASIFLENIRDQCCTTVTNIDIETGNDKRARIDIVYDDSNKKLVFLKKLGFANLPDTYY